MDDCRWMTALGLTPRIELRPLPPGLLERCMNAIRERDRMIEEAEREKETP